MGPSRRHSRAKQHRHRYHTTVCKLDGDTARRAERAHHHLHASVDVDFDPMAVCAPMANTSLLAWFYLLPSKLTDRWTSPLDSLLGTRCTRGSPDQTGVPLEQDSLPYSSRSNTTYMFPYRLLLARFIHRIPHFLR